VTEAVLIGSLGFIFYTYFGYPVLLWLWGRRAKAETFDPAYRPFVTVVISAINEEACIGETVASILACDYPPQALEVVVVSDASTDRTDAIVASFAPPRVRLFRQKTRSGQARNLFWGAQEARGDVVIMADASGRFFPDTVRRLARHFIDPRLGAVSGYKLIRPTGTAVASADGLYARYDRTLRFLESRAGGSWVGCEGGLFAIRKPLFTLDFPLNVAPDNATCYLLYEKGYQHRFDPEARLIESPSLNLQTELRRKIRVIVLQLHGLFVFRRLWAPWRHPAFFFQNVSHKLFRWLVPFALLALLISSALSSHAWARALLALQVLFYALAAAGSAWGNQRKAPKILCIPAYFTAMNLAGLLAWGMLWRDYSFWTPPGRDEKKVPDPASGGNG